MEIRYVGFVLCFACLGFVRAQENTSAEQSGDDAYRFFREIEFLRRGNPFLLSPLRNLGNLHWRKSNNEIRTNEIETEEPERPILFEFNPPLPYQQPPPPPPAPAATAQVQSTVEDRKKRDVNDPETVLIGKIRNKRTHCRKCNKTKYVYVVPSYGGGCNTCGGGGFGGPAIGGYGGGGYGGGSGSFSSSSSQSSSSSFSYGK